MRLAWPFDTRFEFACDDVAHRCTLTHFVDRGLVKQSFIPFALGILGGTGPDPENLTPMKHIADKLSGRSDQGHCPWSVRGAGRDQMPLVTQAALMGGDVRVGLEDPLTVGAGKLAAGNAAQVRPIRDVLESLGLEVATPAEARQVLGLKGKDRVPR